MNPPPTPLPLLPVGLLRQHHCAEPNDTRFRSVARLRQSLWREEHGYACGRYVHPDGRTCRLGSMVSARVRERGVNLIDAALVPPRPSCGVAAWSRHRRHQASTAYIRADYSGSQT